MAVGRPHAGDGPDLSLATDREEKIHGERKGEGKEV
jgi:hypothetical protein